MAGYNADEGFDPEEFVKTSTALSLIALVSTVAVSGCSTLQQALGSSKVAPDEFRVVTKAPLVIPPEFNLRPPRPGEARPMELRPDLQARSALFGASLGVQASDGEKLLVERAGASSVDLGIRSIVDEEASGVVRKSQGFADRIMAFGQRSDGPPGTPLTPEAEALRLAADQSAKQATGDGVVVIQRDRPSGFKLPGM
jgi:hypothetical protein